MTTNISAPNFTLTVNGIDRSANLISLQLEQSQISEKGLILTTGKIVLKARHDQITEFTYLASPSIGANWARNVEVIYNVEGAPFAMSGARLFILKEPASPDANYQITVEIGDEAALRNYPTADDDLSGVTAGVNTDRDEVIRNYLNGAGIANSITDIPYPFSFPQPKLEGESLVEVAGKMARASNHFLYTNSVGTLINEPIDLNASAIATFTISEDEELFEQLDSSGIETPVDELVVSGLVTEVVSETYPKITVNNSFANFTGTFYNTVGFTIVGQYTKKYRYISKRVTITDYGWDGSQERVEIFTEGSTFSPFLPSSELNQLDSNPAALLVPVDFVTQIRRYDQRDRLLEEREEKDVWVTQFFNNVPLPTGNLGARLPSIRNRVDLNDVVTTYEYSDLDVMVSKREETTNYLTTISIQPNAVIYGQTAKEETWLGGAYSIENFYRDGDLDFARNGYSNFVSSTLTEWIPSGGETLYSTDGSTQPPQTVYRKPFEIKESQISVKVKATPFAGDSLRSRPRPLVVPYLVTTAQATEYANTYLALLYGRKHGFVFATAYFSDIKPLARINIIWRGVIYECLADGVVWEHTQKKATLAMSLIVLRTALAATPTVKSPLAIASPLIEGTLPIEVNFLGELTTDNFIGGTLSIEVGFYGRIIADLAIQASLSIQINFLGTLT